MGETNNSSEISIKEVILTIRDYYAFLLTKFKIILAFGLLGGLIGFIYGYTQNFKYTATLTFALEDDKSGGIGALGLAGQLGLDFGGGGGGAFAGGNLIELFKSRKMVEQALLTPISLKGENISLAEMYIQDKEWRDKWKDKPKLKGMQFPPYAKREDFTREQDSVLEVIYKGLSDSDLVVSQKDKKVGMLSIEMKSYSEVFAKAFTESLANVVSNFYIEIKSKKASLNMTILQRQLDSIRGELNGSISGVAVANDRTFSLNPALNVKRVPSIRKQVDVQANTAILTELVKQTELAKVNLRKETPLIQVIDRPIYPLKKEKFGKAKGLILGGFLGGFLTVMILILKRILKTLT